MVTSFQKYERALQAINDITSQHSFETIKRNNTTRMRTKEDNLKKFHVLFNRHKYNKKIVDQHVPQCDNCQRYQLFSDDNRIHFYILSFHVKDWSLMPVELQ